MSSAKTALVRTADLADDLGPRARTIPMSWTCFGGRRVFHGPVCTLRCDGSVGLIKKVLAEPGEGRVLLIDGGLRKDVALVGDNMARLASINGWSGLVVDGAVRDVDVIDGIDLGIFARSAVPKRGSAEPTGHRDLPILVEGVEIEPGMHAFCDGDGLVVCTEQDLASLATSPS